MTRKQAAITLAVLAVVIAVLSVPVKYLEAGVIAGLFFSIPVLVVTGVGYCVFRIVKPKRRASE